MKKRIHGAIKKQLLRICLALAFIHIKGAVDYNGNPITRGGSIIITPRTPPAILASYTQVVNFDGLVDKTFGAAGFSIPIIGGTDNQAYACTLQPDGKILATGWSGNGLGNNNFALVRCNPNGTTDSSFGAGNGIVTTNLGGANNQAFSCALQPDGKIIAAGSSNIRVGFSDFALVRYFSNGTPDPSFGTDDNGIVIIPISGTDGPTTNQAYACTLQSDGKIIVAGSSDKYDTSLFSDNFAVVRYLANGIPDSSFGADGNGIVVTSTTGRNDDTNQAYACLLQPDGKIIAVGYSTNQQVDPPVTDFALIRYDAYGIQDPSFGVNGNGIVTTNLGGDNNFAYAGALQPDGKIIVAGTTNKIAGGATHSFALVRYLSNGTPDPSFGTNGIVVTDIAGGTNANSQAYACTVQSDGKIIAAGWSNKEGVNIYDFTLVRYNSNGTPDSTFGVNGIMTTNLGGIYSEAYACTLQPDGKVVTVGYSNATKGGVGTNYDFAIVRYINPFTLASFTASYGEVGLL